MAAAVAAREHLGRLRPLYCLRRLAFAFGALSVAARRTPCLALALACAAVPLAAGVPSGPSAGGGRGGKFDGRAPAGRMGGGGVCHTCCTGGGVRCC